VNFEELLASFETDEAPSHTRDRPTLEQECVAAAKRGWGKLSNAPWPAAAEPAVRNYFREELPDEVLESHGHEAAMWALFASYAIGWIFSLKHDGVLDEDGAGLAFAQLPGFMWLHEARVSRSGG
jgi:hypothetical protein